MCRFLSSSIRRAAVCVCALLAYCVWATPARADHPPKFKDPEVTAYFQTMSDIVDSLLTAVKAKDDAKIKEWTGKLLDTSKTGESLKTKVSPEEDEIASKWGQDQMQKLLDAGWSPSS